MRAFWLRGHDLQMTAQFNSKVDYVVRQSASRIFSQGVSCAVRRSEPSVVFEKTFTFNSSVSEFR